MNIFFPASVTRPSSRCARSAPANGAQIFLKIESENPTGSMKDRMALAMIVAAERDGRLKPGGSTGVSLALVCAVKKYALHIVSSDAFSSQKLDHMGILGAQLEIVKSESGGMTEKLTRAMIAAADAIHKETGAFWTDQHALLSSELRLSHNSAVNKIGQLSAAYFSLPVAYFVFS